LGSVLSSAEIRSLIGKSPPLIENFLDIEAQLQPNGFDLTLSEIRRYDGLGRIAISNSGRVLPGLVEIPPGDRSDIRRFGMRDTPVGRPLCSSWPTRRDFRWKSGPA
jgi:hypothetical protein